MIDLIPIIADLRKELKLITDNNEKELDELSTELKRTVDYTNYFEKIWIGAWAQDDYDHYQNPNNQNQSIRGTEDFFYDYILKKTGLNVDIIGKRVIELVDIFKKLQKKVCIELSVIKDDEKLAKQIQLLERIENYKWGFETMDFVKYRMPGKMIISNPRSINRGAIPVPPHLNVLGYLTSLNTKTQAPKDFHEMLTQLLRQLEIKTTTPGASQANSPDSILSNILENFHSFCSQLKNRHAGRSSIDVTDEYDVQDLLHCILRLHYKDVREEEYTPSYAGSSTRVDFLLKNENVVIEVKKTRQGLSDKQVGDQLILDAAHYRNHPNCKALICFVYDPESRIKNPRGLENDIKKLSDTEMSIELLIRP